MRRRRTRRYRGAYPIQTVILVAAIILVIVAAGGATGIVFYRAYEKRETRKQALVSFQAGQYETAIPLLESAITQRGYYMEEFDISTKELLADAYMQAGRYEAAETSYGELVQVVEDETKKNAIEYRMQLAKALKLYEQEQYQEAVVIWKELVAKDTKFNLYLGNCYAALNQTTEMKSAYEAYLQVDTDNSFVYAQLANMYLEQEDYDMAKKMITTGLSKEDTSGRKQLLFAQIVYQERQLAFEEAYKLAKTYVEQYPDDEAGKKEYEFLETR